MKNKITTKLNVQDNLINVMRVGNVDYISLTDLARYKNPDNPGDVVIKWMSNKSSFDFYSLWEALFNENFKLAESCEFKNGAGKISPKKALEKAENEYEKFRIKQDRDYISSMEEMYKNI